MDIFAFDFVFDFAYYILFPFESWSIYLHHQHPGTTGVYSTCPLMAAPYPSPARVGPIFGTQGAALTIGHLVVIFAEVKWGWFSSASLSSPLHPPHPHCVSKLHH